MLRGASSHARARPARDRALWSPSALKRLTQRRTSRLHIRIARAGTFAPQLTGPRDCPSWSMTPVIDGLARCCHAVQWMRSATRHEGRGRQRGGCREARWPRPEAKRSPDVRPTATLCNERLVGRTSRGPCRLARSVARPTRPWTAAAGSGSPRFLRWRPERAPQDCRLDELAED